MARDTSYSLLVSGSTVASANTLHRLYGVYDGLSDLNSDQVVHLQLQASGADLRLTPTNASVVTDYGIWLKANTNAYIDLPAQKISAASELHFRNHVAGNNVVVRWALWQRIP